MKIKALIGAGLMLVIASPANATALLFQLNEIGGNGESYTFTVDSHPAQAGANGGGILVGPTTITGTGPGVGSNYLAFGYSGGMQIRTGTGAASAVVGLALGDDLTTGTGAATTLNTGTFSLSGSSGMFTLNVAAVPEASTWAMMLAGFGLFGLAMRSRRRTVDALTA